MVTDLRVLIELGLRVVGARGGLPVVILPQGWEPDGLPEAVAQAWATQPQLTGHTSGGLHVTGGRPCIVSGRMLDVRNPPCRPRAQRGLCNIGHSGGELPDCMTPVASNP